MTNGRASSAKFLLRLRRGWPIEARRRFVEFVFCGFGLEAVSKLYSKGCQLSVVETFLYGFPDSLLDEFKNFDLLVGMIPEFGIG